MGQPRRDRGRSKGAVPLLHSCGVRRTGAIALLAAAVGTAGAVEPPVQPAMQEWRLADMAQEIRNPIAQLLQFPFELDGDGHVGPDRAGEQVHLDLKSIVPIPLGPRWTLISWSKIPIYRQQDVHGDSGTQVGLSNTQLRFFVSPARVRRGLLQEGFIWGLGPMLTLPTTNPQIGAEQTSGGFDASVCWQGRPFSVGLLAYQIFGFAGPGTRTNEAYLQPFLSYTTASAWSATLNTESEYFWTSGAWEVPINLQVSKLLKLAGLHLSFLLGARYWASAPDSSPHGWGGRASVTLVLPDLLEGD